MSALLQMRNMEPDFYDTTSIQFGEWLPDAPENNNPGAVEALNIIPAEQCYVPFPEHAPEEGADLTSTVRGAIAVISPTDTVQVYAGAIDGIYTKFGAAFSSLYAASVSEEFAWKFIRVNEQMVAIHPDQFPIRTPVGTTTPAVLVAGSPPRAACGAQVGDFLMLGNLLEDPDDFGNAFPSRVRWSGFNNIELPWVTDVATQADFQDMPAEGGPVIAINGREVATIFQARMISRATYRGLPAVFDFAVVEDKRGALSRDCIVDIGAFQMFIAEDGFFIWNGTNATPIGDGRVNRYFFNRLEYSMRSRICGAVDFANGCVIWAFPTDSSGILTELIIYSYRENRWSHSVQTLEFLFNSAASNLSAEDLVLPAEDYDISFDDASFLSGGRSRLAAFDDAHTYGLFTGPNMAVILDTGEFSGPKNRRAFTASVRPNVDLAIPVATVQLAMRDQMIGQPIVFSDAVAQEIDGQCPILGDARFMRYRVNLPAGVAWQHATGVDVMRKATGIF